MVGRQPGKALPLEMRVKGSLVANKDAIIVDDDEMSVSFTAVRLQLVDRYADIFA